jgi:signal transduction histidine kinase
MSKQNVIVSKEYQEEVSPILVDKSQMKQVFLNLVLNSIQAMPDSGELKIATDGIEGSSGRFLRVQVSDTGAGFDASIQERLFVPFFTTRADGTGLGLSVAYRIVESHGGTIRAQSEKGIGATFTVELPYQRG